MRGLLSETVNHKFSAEGIALWVPTLIRRWLEPAGLHSNKNVEAVLSKLDSLNLPKTAHVVSMVLWTVERRKTR